MIDVSNRIGCFQTITLVGIPHSGLELITLNQAILVAINQESYPIGNARLFILNGADFHARLFQNPWGGMGLLPQHLLHEASLVGIGMREEDFFFMHPACHYSFRYEPPAN